MPEIAAIANPNLMALTGGAVNQDIEHLESKHRVPQLAVSAGPAMETFYRGVRPVLIEVGKVGNH